MQHRSTGKVLLLSIVSLTLYDFYWLAVTSQELTRQTGIRLKRASWNILFAAARIFTVLVIVWAFHVLVFAHATPASKQCQQQYRYNATISATTYPLTNACSHAIESFQHHQAEQASAFKLLLVAFVVGVGLNNLLFQRWLVPYVKAAETATGGRLNATNSMALLLLREPYGVTMLQQAYNSPTGMPDAFGMDVLMPLHNRIPKYENTALQHLLSIIAVAMIVGLLLFFAFIFVVSQG